MKPITVSKAVLLGKMRANRDRHRSIFLEALEGYRQHALEVLEGQVKDLAAGKVPHIHFDLSRPEDHTRDYDRVIGMLEMHQGEQFELTEQDYSQYVNDDWGWKQRWSVSNSGYVSAGTKFSNRDYFED